MRVTYVRLQFIRFCVKNLSKMISCSLKKDLIRFQLKVCSEFILLTLVGTLENLKNFLMKSIAINSCGGQVKASEIFSSIILSSAILLYSSTKLYRKPYIEGIKESYI